MNITGREKDVKNIVVGKCWDYLNDNFHKFSDGNKLKVALELCKKNMPQEMTGQVNFVQMPTITKDGKPLDYNIGEKIEPDVPKDS